MPSRERVMAALENHPDRVPVRYGASAEFWEKVKPALGLDDEDLRAAIVLNNS